MSMGERALVTPDAPHTHTASRHKTPERQVLKKLRFKNMADFLSLASFTQDPTFAARVSTAHPHWFSILVVFDHGLQAAGQGLFPHVVAALAQGCKGGWCEATTF
jgi:hypothetical protein